MRDALLILALVAGCAVAQYPKPPPVDLGEVEALCARSCAVCPARSPGPDLTYFTADDQSCEAACFEEVDGDPTLIEMLRCEALSPSCDAQDACESLVP